MIDILKRHTKTCDDMYTRSLFFPLVSLPYTKIHDDCHTKRALMICVLKGYDDRHTKTL